jgi:Stage II sporulation protein E (SpoIIE)/GAF domain
MMPRPAGRRLVRRLAARLAGQPPAVTDSVLRPGEVLVFDGASPSFRAMSTGRPVRSDHLGQETVDRLTRRPGGHQLAAGYTTFLAVPLAARGLVLGCATFAWAPRDPGFEPDDIALAAELAARAAVCIDNARLYDRERRTAFALQHGLLPREPRIPTGMEVAHRYFPVGASVVGGDWHDIVRLPGGRAALIVGDAMGHGPEAAAVMVQLRTAAHTLASLDLPPEDILHRLDRMAAGMPAAPFATCISAGSRPVPGDHPRPVHRRPGGEPHPAAGRGHRRAGCSPGRGAGPGRRRTRHRLRNGHPGAAPARRR